MRKAPFLIGLLLIFVIGIFLRFYQLGQVPSSLYWDEVAILVDAKAIAAAGHDMYGNAWLQAIFPSYGDFKLPVYIWLASLSVKFFGVTEWAVRLPSALAGIATLIAGGLISWELFAGQKRPERRTLFFLTALVVAVAPWSIMFSRTGFEGHVGQLLLALSIWCALQARRHWGWAVASALLGSVATYTYFSIRFVWPVVFATAVLLFSRRKQQKIVLWVGATLLFPLLVYWAGLWPLFHSPLYAASNQFRLSTTSVFNMAEWPVLSNQYKLQAGNTILDKAVYHPKVLMLRELARNYSDNLSLDFLFFTGDPNLRHGTLRHGLFLWIFLAPFLYGWYSLFAKYNKQGLFLLIWWLIALLPASVPETTPHALRSLNALAPLSVVIGWGTWQLWQAFWQARWVSWLKWLAAGGALALVSLTVFDFSSYYFLAYPTKSASEWQENYKEIAQEAWDNRQEMDVVWVDPFDSRFYLWLMAYHVPAAEFGQITFNNYTPAVIGNIRFRWFDWGKLPTLSEKTVVIARKTEIDWRLETVSYQPKWYKTFNQADGRPEFAAIFFEKSQ